MRLIQLEGVSIAQQLAMEEGLLRTDPGSFCIINVGSTPAFVLGISSKIEEVIDLDRGLNLPVIRRFSGGGTVVVDENTVFVTFLGPLRAVGGVANPDAVHAHFTKFYHQVFQELEFSYLQNDYRIGEKKIGGNAQYFTKDRYLHHTSFLFDWSPHLMQGLRHPPKMPAYRQGRLHQDFLGKLSEYFSSKAEFIKLIINKLQAKKVDPIWEFPPHRRGLKILPIG